MTFGTRVEIDMCTGVLTGTIEGTATILNAEERLVMLYVVRLDTPIQTLHSLFGRVFITNVHPDNLTVIG